MNRFYLLKVLGRGSKIQRQVGENIYMLGPLSYVILYKFSPTATQNFKWVKNPHIFFI